MLKIVISLIGAALCVSNTASLACDLAYEVRSDEIVAELCVTIDKHTDGITYRSTYRDVKQLYHYTIDNTLIHWEYIDPGAKSNFSANRNGSEIIIRGILHGQPVNKSLVAGDLVWLQNSEFGLLEFLKTQEKTKEFMVIAPEDLSIKKLRATRAAEKDISWKGNQVRVVKVTARLRGFLSLFWQATYWHRLPELTFLRYKADGLPGVPGVDIHLVRETTVR